MNRRICQVSGRHIRRRTSLSTVLRRGGAAVVFCLWAALVQAVVSGGAAWLVRQDNLRFYSRFFEPTWSQLDDGARLAAMQEAVVRSGVMCSVSWMEEETAASGIFSTERGIEVTGRYRRGHSFDPNGRMAESGLCALETALHEARHAYQALAVFGRVREEPGLVEAWRANVSGSGSIMDAQGEERRVSLYIRSDETSVGYLMYYLQPTEIDAFRFAQERVKEIIELKKADLLREYGEAGGDEAYACLRDIAAYEALLQRIGWEQVVKRGEAQFDNENLMQDISAVLKNAHLGTRAFPVSDRNTEIVVEEQMVKSLQR